MTAQCGPDIFDLINRLPEAEMGHEEHEVLAAVQCTVGRLVAVCEALEDELSILWGAYETPELLVQLREAIAAAYGRKIKDAP